MMRTPRWPWQRPNLRLAASLPLESVPANADAPSHLTRRLPRNLRLSFPCATVFAASAEIASF